MIMQKLPNRFDQYLFDAIHPTIILVFGIAVVAFSMIVVHPIYLGISFLAAFCLSVYVRGWRSSLQIIAWQLPLTFLIVVINPFFAEVGTTVFLQVGSMTFYRESILYGICMGLMLSSVVFWFVNLARLLSADRLMALLGNRAPTVSFMLSSVMRAVPRFLRQGTYISQVTKAASSAQGAKGFQSLGSHARTISVLMSWSMEDSIDTSDSMRARGWASKATRTAYQPFRFRIGDTVSLVMLVLLIALNVVLVWYGYRDFHFYPTVSDLTWWWGYLSFSILCFLPLMVCVFDYARWSR